MTILLDDGNAGDAIALHHLNRIRDWMIGRHRNGSTIIPDSLRFTLSTRRVDLDGKILVNTPIAALLRYGDRKVRFSHRIHRCG